MGEAFRRLRRKLCGRTVNSFGRVVDWLTWHALQDASQLLVIGEDIRAPAGLARLNRIAERRIAQHAGRDHVAALLQELSPAFRKAVVAVVFAWLRVQFPVLNAPAAVAAAGVLHSLLKSDGSSEGQR